MKQTAVEWLIDMLVTENEITLKGENYKLFDQAQAMEKEQIVEAYCNGCLDITKDENIFPRETSEQYKMKLQNCDIEHTFVEGIDEVTFTWTDNGYTFYVSAEYELDYMVDDVEVYIDRILVSEFWSDLEDAQTFVLTEVMVNYLSDELNNFAHDDNEEIFRLQERMHHRFNYED